jgi:NAD(P)H-dependent FMN reductase
MRIAIILGSTRVGRVGQRVARWVESTAREKIHEDIALLDLLDFELPFLREAGPPRYTPDRKPSPKVQPWLDAIAAADGYIIVTPEYNRSFPGELKNALDTIGHEADRKPAAIISYSGTPTGGLAAQEALRPVINFIEMIPTPAVLAIPNAQLQVNEDGTLSSEAVSGPRSLQGGLDALLQELIWYAVALKTARERSLPAPS